MKKMEADYPLRFGDADREGRVRVLNGSIEDARVLIDFVPNHYDDLMVALDEAQIGAATQGKTRYVILIINP